METTRGTSSTLKTTDIVYIGLFAVLIAICSWISLPAAVPFTMQTFGVFLTVMMLGGKRGVIAVIVYLLMGAIGLPVFAGFSGGIGVLFGATGGYLIGFIFTALIMWLFEKLFGEGTAAAAAGMIVGLAACYAFGTAWFIRVYTGSTGPVSVVTALGWCVFPFIIPDAVKMVIAVNAGKRLRRLMYQRG